MNKDTWIGKVVSFDSQADQVTGQGWGWRYKVRIMGDYSEKDGIEDKRCNLCNGWITSNCW